MTLSEYRNLMQSILSLKAIEAAKDPVYKSNKYLDEDAIALLNEGYIAGLTQAEFTLEKSKFLTDKE